MARYAVYSGTRNLYGDMLPAVKSLVANSPVDKVFLLIEDEQFPYALPDLVEPMDVSSQRSFWAGSPNSGTPFTYMALLRCAYTRVLPAHVDKVLQLDVDTVVVSDIAELWDVDMKSSWLMAVDEPLSSNKPFGPRYVNIGVTMFNLDQIRKDGIEDKLIEWLKTTKTPYIEQDAWNKFGNERTINLPTRFNECLPCGFTDDPAIVHYAAYKNWQTDSRVPRREYLRKYREMSWDEVMDRHGRQA